MFIIALTYLINIFLKIVKSQCSPFSTEKQTNKRPHTLFPLTLIFSKEISQESGVTKENMQNSLIFH